MPDTVTINEDFEFIQVDSWGEVSEQDLLHLFETVMKIKKEHGLTKLLVDATRQTNTPGTVFLYEFGSKIAEEACDMKCAIGVSPELNIEDYHFFATVAKNRGADLKIFDSCVAAFSWLIN